MGREGHDMGAQHIEIPLRPGGALREGTYRIERTPFVVLGWQEIDSRKIARTRTEALVHVLATIDATGHEDTKPKALWMKSRAFENFNKTVEIIERAGDHEYDPHEWMVHVDEHGELDFINAPG